MQIADFLIGMKVDPSIEDLNGDELTPLHLAAGFDRIETARKLIEAGANVNAIDSSDMSPLAYAIKPSNQDMIMLFLSNGAKLYDNDGFTLLHYAAISGANIALRLLIEKGAADEMRIHGTRLLQGLKHCQIGIEDQFFTEFEKFLKKEGLHPDQLNNNHDEDDTEQIVDNEQNYTSINKIPYSSSRAGQKQDSINDKNFEH